MMFDTSVTDGDSTLFIHIDGGNSKDSYRGFLNIKLAGMNHNHERLEVNKAMSELLIRKARLSDLYYELLTPQIYHIAACRLQCAAQELIKEGDFDLLFW